MSVITINNNIDTSFFVGISASHGCTKSPENSSIQFTSFPHAIKTFAKIFHDPRISRGCDASEYCLEWNEEYSNNNNKRVTNKIHCVRAASHGHVAIRPTSPTATNRGVSSLHLLLVPFVCIFEACARPAPAKCDHSRKVDQVNHEIHKNIRHNGQQTAHQKGENHKYIPKTTTARSTARREEKNQGKRRPSVWKWLFMLRQILFELCSMVEIQFNHSLVPSSAQRRFTRIRWWHLKHFITGLAKANIKSLYKGIKDGEQEGANPKYS